MMWLRDVEDFRVYVPSGPFIIRVPFFILVGFDKGTLNEKGPKGPTQDPRSYKRASVQLLQNDNGEPYKTW